MPANLKTINITSRHNTEKKYISLKMLTLGFKDVFSQTREKVWGFVVGASGLVISGLPTGLLVDKENPDTKARGGPKT